jgi:hypothetical protein
MNFNENKTGDEFLFANQYMKKLYGDKWFKKYKFIEEISNYKTRSGKPISWLKVFDKFDNNNSKIINKIFGFESISKISNKPYRKYIFKKNNITTVKNKIIENLSNDDETHNFFKNN